MGGYITVHAHTEVLTRQAPNSMRTKGGETLSLMLMDKERVCFCVQTFNRVTEGPVVLEICRGKVESQTVNYDYSHFGQLPARVQVSK